MDFSKVCHANLQGNLEAASDTFKNAIDMAEKKKLHSLPSLFIHYSRLKYMVRNPGTPESAASEATKFSLCRNSVLVCRALCLARKECIAFGGYA